MNDEHNYSIKLIMHEGKLSFIDHNCWNNSDPKQIQIKLVYILLHGVFSFDKFNFV